MKQSKNCNLFMIAEENKKFIIVMGNYKISKKEFTSEEAAEKYIASKPWELITNAVGVILQYQNQKQNEKTN